MSEEKGWLAHRKTEYATRTGKRLTDQTLADLVAGQCDGFKVSRPDLNTLCRQLRKDPTAPKLSDGKMAAMLRGLESVFGVSRDDLLRPEPLAGAGATEPKPRKSTDVGEFSPLLQAHEVQFVAILRRGRIIAHDFDTKTIHDRLKDGAEEWMDVCRRNCMQIVDSFDKMNGSLDILGQGVLIRMILDVEEGSFMTFPLPFHTRVFAAVLVEQNVVVADKNMKRAVESVWEQRSGVIKRKYTH